MYNKIALFNGPYEIEYSHTELPYPQNKEVCVKFEFCSICGGDYSTYIGRRNNYPYSLGHEFVGKVVRVGEEVTSFAKGDYVVSDFNYRCGKCEFCNNNKSHLCDSNDIGCFSNRAFSTFANIHEEYLFKVPILPYVPRACLIEPLSCVLHACNIMALQPNQTILISGGGGLGSLFCFYLTRIIKNPNVYLNEINKQKLIKITSAFNIKTFEQSSISQYDWIIDCSNSYSGVNFALDLCKKGSHICVMSHLYGLNTTFIYDKICSKELSVVFPLRNGDKNNMFMAINYIDKFWHQSDDKLLEIYDDISKAFKEKNNSNFCKQIVDLSNFSAIR